MKANRFLELHKKHTIIDAVGGLFIDPNSELFQMYAYLTESGSIEFCQASDEALESKQYTDLHDYTLAIKKAMGV